MVFTLLILLFSVTLIDGQSCDGEEFYNCTTQQCQSCKQATYD